MFSRLLLSSTLLAALSAVHATYRPCIDDVKNPSFEYCKASGKYGVTIPNDWTQDARDSYDNPSVYCSSDMSHTGSKSVKFAPQLYIDSETHDISYYAEIYQNVGLVQAGQLITLTYWLSYGGVSIGETPHPSSLYRFTTWYNDDQQNEIELDPQYVSGSATSPHYFYQYKATFFAPHNQGSRGYITIGFESTDASVYIYLDDIEVHAPCISGDPQFIGLRGQSYQVHGIDGEVYNLVSSANTQINSAFTFLTHGQCPIFNGIPAHNCWSHAGSYLGAIGVQQRVGDKTHQLKIVSGSAADGFTSVDLNGVPMKIGQTFTDSQMFVVNFTHSHHVTVQVEEFILGFDNSDMFINQAVAPRLPLSKLASHGLFGQTHRNKLFNTPLRYIEGQVDDYMINDHDLFGVEFVYNRFTKKE